MNNKETVESLIADAIGEVMSVAVGIIRLDDQAGREYDPEFFHSKVLQAAARVVAAIPSLSVVRAETLEEAKAETWDAAILHLWQLNDPAYTILEDSGSSEPLVTRNDVEQALRENPFRAAAIRQEGETK